jgi:putative flippase GtrA
MPRARLVELVRYLIVGGLNTAFGFGIYAALVWSGLDRYLAQAAGYVLGTAFNYLTYSRGVFTGSGPAKIRFVLSYLGNYALNLLSLGLISRFMADAYAAGALTTLLMVALNYFVLKRWVFRPAAT